MLVYAIKLLIIINTLILSFLYINMIFDRLNVQTLWISAYEGTPSLISEDLLLVLNL